VTSYQLVANIEVENRHGFEYLVVRVMKRERRVLDGGELGEFVDHPLNIGSNTYAEDAPFHGLEMNGYFRDGGGMIGFRPMYYNVAFIETRQAQAMAKMLAKIDRVLQKAQAHEVGDVFMAFCKAVGIKSVAFCPVPPRQRHSTIADNDWRFDTLEEGRDRLRKLCAEHDKAVA
jgi:hypothetical protein